MADRLATQMTNDTTGATGRTPATQADVSVLDYQDLIGRCLGNLAFAEKILSNFERRLEQDLVLLEREIDEPDADGIAQVAHRLKGACASVSANGLCDVFDRIERLGRTEQLREVPDCMDELRSNLCRFKAQTRLVSETSQPSELTTNESWGSVGAVNRDASSHRRR